MADKQTIERLKDQALEMRELVLKLSAKTVIHLGGDLSMADMMTALYMYKMKRISITTGNGRRGTVSFSQRGTAPGVCTLQWPWPAMEA